MNLLNKNFPNVSHVILPVIHVESQDQAIRNAALAKQSGCNGVFLINHSIGVSELLEAHRRVVEEMPGWWVGVNCLGVHPRQVFGLLNDAVRGVWVDNAQIDERADQQPTGKAILGARATSGWQGLYFGGVAFKYQRTVEDLATAARVAAQYMDVVTTSGPRTGHAASVEKIRMMKNPIGDFPLAIASGLTPLNVTDYLEVADCFLVATGVSSSWSELDPLRLNDFVQVVRTYGLRNFKNPRLVCFVCEWNEGRSAHLELSVRHKLQAAGSSIEVMSAGFSQGGGIGPLREEFLRKLGVPDKNIEQHRALRFGQQHAQADLVLVAEMPMKERLLRQWPQLEGRIMTVRGFAMGYGPGNESLSAAEAHIEDAGGHSVPEKLQLYAELEGLAAQIGRRLTQAAQPQGCDITPQKVPPTSERMLSVQRDHEIPTRFAVIFGSDHHSFPDSLNRTRDLGLTDVLHFTDLGFDDAPCSHDRYGLSHITLKSIVVPLRTKNYNWETIAELDDRAARSPLSLPVRVGEACVAAISGRPIFEMSADELHLFHQSLEQQLGIPAEGIRLVIVPNIEAGWCRWAAKSLEVRREHSYGVPDPLSLDPSSVYFISPGNCRAHLFCVFKGMGRRIHWYGCS